MKKLPRLVFLAVSLVLAVTTFVSAQERPAQGGALPQKSIDRIVREVRHELVTLPYYGVFDNLAYKVDPDGTVTLMGQVANPTLKSDAERALKRIQGVEKVVNNIELLPTSPNDDRIRLAVYRAISGHHTLNIDQLGEVPRIHIIVKKGM